MDEATDQVEDKNRSFSITNRLETYHYTQIQDLQFAEARSI